MFIYILCSRAHAIAEEMAIFHGLYEIHQKTTDSECMSNNKLEHRTATKISLLITLTTCLVSYSPKISMCVCFFPFHFWCGHCWILIFYIQPKAKKKREREKKIWYKVTNKHDRYDEKVEKKKKKKNWVHLITCRNSGNSVFGALFIAQKVWMRTFVRNTF